VLYMCLSLHWTTQIVGSALRCVVAGAVLCWYVPLHAARYPAVILLCHLI
jgi:hypothetical protein